jgi:hypothetical protein
MDAFTTALMERSPLAASVLESFDFVLDEQTLRDVYEPNRGRCYEDTLTFDDVLRLTRDALIRHGGSAHQLFTQLERTGANPADESSFYRKLANMPVPVSRALLSRGTARLAQLMPAGYGRATLPVCFDAFTVVADDGKKIKNAAKRLKPTRGFAGKLIGAKALVAMDLRSGLVLAMSDSLDGEANDVPLVPELLPQVYQAVGAAAPVLFVVDRQFGDARTMRRLSARPGDHYVVRLRKGLTFVAEPASTVTRRDEQGREVVDEVGVLFAGPQATRTRRVTLRRPGEEDLVLATDLLDREAFPAEAVLAAYKARWGIEQAFQQVTETFALGHLIGSAPEAVLFQFAFCLLLYNMMQVVRAHVADDGGVGPGEVSMFFLFEDVKDELRAWAYYTDGHWPRRERTAGQMRARLRELLTGSWDPIAYHKHADKKPRKPVPKQRLHGGHSSVQRVLEGRAKVVARA